MVERRLTDDERAPWRPLGRGPDGRSTDTGVGTRCAAWVLRSLNYCSSCGGAAGRAACRRRRTASGDDCPGCGFVAYVNPRLVVTTIPVTDAGEAVLLRRGIEPGYGSWAQPGGFLEVDETVTEAAIRETLEETGPARPARRADRPVLAARGRGRDAGLRGADRRRRSPRPPRRRSRSGRSPRTPSRGTRWRSRPRYFAMRDWVETRHPGVPLPSAFGGHEPF